METEPGKLFVGGISWDTSEERLRDHFQTFGEVVEAVIMKDRNTGRARGFGFVVFANAAVAERVVRERHVIDGRLVEAKKAVPRDDHHQNSNRNSVSTQGSPGPTRTKKIFVGGLPSSITESNFKQYFDQFGTITDVVVMYDHNTQRPRGFGFITYATEESVDKVLFKTFHELNGKMVEVKRAVPKELSPGPTRNYGMNRVNSLLNAYAQGHNSMSPGNYGMRIDGHYSPITMDRGGLSPYGPGNFNIGHNPDSGLSLNYGNGDSGLNYGNGTSSFFSGTPSRFNSPMSNDFGNGISGSLPNTANRTMWVNGSPNYSTNSLNSNAFMSHGTGNHGILNNLGTIGEIWGRSINGGNSSLSNGNIVRNENDFGGRKVQYRNNEGNIGSTSSYNISSNVREEGIMENLYAGDSFYTSHPWHSLPNELDVSANKASNNSAGFLGYSATARTNRGIAA